MPKLQNSADLPLPLSTLWAFLAVPRNLSTLIPPNFHLTLEQAPPLIHLGAVLVWKAHRFGLAHRIILQVAAFEEGQSWTEEQHQGPFALWRHERRLKPWNDGTRLEEFIEFSPPTGLLGRWATPDRVAADWEELWTYRTQVLRNLFSS